MTYKILHPDNDPNNLIAVFEWDNLNNAKNFVNSQELTEKEITLNDLGKTKAAASTP